MAGRYAARITFAARASVERIESLLLSTGDVASFLGVSRQHVVDLCDRGDLIFVRVGSHRRVPRFELDRLLGAIHGGELTRDQERSLWLHRAMLAELVENPEDVLARWVGIYSACGPSILRAA